MINLSVEHRSPSDLKPYARNARTHSPKQIAEIAASIKAFGFNNPVLIDKDNGIVAGHGRVEAAKLLGLVTVPTIRLEHLTEAQKRAYILADNKLAEKAGWDREILAIELQNLMEIDLDFDISATGFELPEIDVLIEGLETKPSKADPADEVPTIEGPAVTRLGDIWHIGPHRLICGDPDYANTALCIAHFTTPKTGPRVLKTAMDEGVELYGMDELQSMVTETYSIWADVWHDRVENTRRSGTRGSDGFL